MDTLIGGGVINQQRKERFQNTVDGRVAQALSIIGDKQGEGVFPWREVGSSVYADHFKYKWRRFHIGTLSSTAEDECPKYIAKLEDVFCSPDFKDALKLVEERKWVNITIDNVLDIEHVLQDISGKKSSFNPVYILRDKGVKDLQKMKKFTGEIMKDIEGFLWSEYEVILNNTSYRIALSPKTHEAKEKLINHDAGFRKSLQDILTYRKDILPAKLEKVDDIVAQQQWENDSAYDSQIQIIDFLRKQLNTDP